MCFTGLVCSEYSSGSKIVRGSITKAGNARSRRLLGEAAWNYRKNLRLSAYIAKRREGCRYEVLSIAQKADLELATHVGCGCGTAGRRVERRPRP